MKDGKYFEPTKEVTNQKPVLNGFYVVKSWKQMKREYGSGFLGDINVFGSYTKKMEGLVSKIRGRVIEVRGNQWHRFHICRDMLIGQIIPEYKNGELKGISFKYFDEKKGEKEEMKDITPIFKVGEWVEFENSLYYYNGEDKDGDHLLVGHKYNVGDEGANDAFVRNFEKIKIASQVPNWFKYIGEEVYVWNGNRPEAPEKRILVSVIDGKCHAVRLGEKPNFLDGLMYSSVVCDHWEPIVPTKTKKTVTLELTDDQLEKIKGFLDE